MTSDVSDVPEAAVSNRSKQPLYSLTSSAVPSSVGGTTVRHLRPRGAGSEGPLRRANGKQLVLSFTDFGPNAPF
jgi:hypothetical protein